MNMIPDFELRVDGCRNALNFDDATSIVHVLKSA